MQDTKKNKKKLGLGYQSMFDLKSYNCYYVDKTKYVHKMVENYEGCFLTRPRRFGKTMLLNTIESLFKGESEVFQDTYIYDKWDFKKNICPVVNLNFIGAGSCAKDTLYNSIYSQFYSIEKSIGIVGGEKLPLYAERLYNIIKTLSKDKKDVVILIDEFDKPIIDNIDNKEVVRSNSKIFSELYNAIKSCREFLRFVFVTGLTFPPKDKFGSGMSYLTDISLDPEFSAACGFTEQELCDVFSPEFEKVSLERIRDFYLGYSWGGETVYNPYSITYCFDRKSTRMWWIYTCRPVTVYNILKQKNFFLIEMGRLWVNKSDVNYFDVDDILINPFLFQLGYLTIKKTSYDNQDKDNRDNKDKNNQIRYYLDHVNKETKRGFIDDMFDQCYYYFELNEEFRRLAKLVVSDLANKQFDKVRETLKLLYEIEPSSFKKQNIPLTNYQSWYVSYLLYIFFTANAKVSSEYSSAPPYSPVVLEHKKDVFVFKVDIIEDNKKPKQAEINRVSEACLDYIKQHGYIDRYSSLADNFYSVAVVMSNKQKNIVKINFKQKK